MPKKKREMEILLKSLKKIKNILLEPNPQIPGQVFPPHGQVPPHGLQVQNRGK